MDETLLVPRARLLEMTSLPTSDELKARLVMLEAAQASGETVHGIQMMSAKRRLELGRERDRLQEQRPSGCVCLGLGVTEGQPCGCPDGIAMVEERKRREANRRRQDISGYLARTLVPPRFEDCTFDSHPLRGQPCWQRVREWRPTREKSGLFIYGGYGTGKTGLAVSALKTHIEREVAGGWFYVVSDLLEQTRRSYGGEGADPLQEVRGRGFVVLDDLGAERPTEWVQERLFQLINHRHGHFLPTIITSNLDMAHIAGALGERIAGRLTEMCIVVEVEGRDLRVPQESKGRSTGHG